MTEIERIPIRDETFIVEARKKVQALARDLKFDSVETTRLATVTSELTRYISQYKEPVLDIGIERKDGNFNLKLIFQCKKERSETAPLEFEKERFFDDFNISHTPEGREILEGVKYIEDPTFTPTQQFINLEKEKLFRLTKSEELIVLIGQVKADKVKIEKMVEELKKLDQLKSDFISMVSHELRTPLSVTKEGVSLVLDKIPGKINEKQEKILITARNNINRLARIINDILDISKIEAGEVELKRELVNMTSLIKEVISSFVPKAKEKGLELKVSIPKKGIDVYADSDKIIQVFTNLIGNAIKFTEKGYIEISVVEKVREAKCTVTDTGIGISKENLLKIFDKFQQIGYVMGAEEKGTGLGLSIAKGIVEMHNGKIWAESEFGKGTKFIFTLPKYTPKAILKEYINRGIKEAMEKDSKMSLIVVSIAEFNKLRQQFPAKKIRSVLKNMEDVLRDSLRREGDVALRDSSEIVVILADCDRENSLRVEGRLEQSLNDYLVRQKLANKIKLRFRCATFPDDAKSAEGLIKKAKKSK